jgi:DNA-binding MarR family transcriptional regulator
VKELHNSSEAPSSDARAALGRLFEFTVLMSQAMEKDLADRGLTRARATVIAHLHRHGPVRQRELAEALHVTPRNVTGLLDALEATGFVERSAHPTDRRATLVTLTREGAAIAEAMAVDERVLAAFLFDGVGADALAGFLAMLDQVVARLRDEDFAALREAATERWPSRPSA